jgi:hypothetical protein
VSDPVVSRRYRFLIVNFTPGLKAVPRGFVTSARTTYRPFGTVAVFQLHSQPYGVEPAVQRTGPEWPYEPP